MLTEDTFVSGETVADSLLGELAAPADGGDSASQGWVVISPSGEETLRLASRLEERLRASGGVAFVAGWREGFLRPFGALLDLVEDLAAWAQPRQPELLQRFGWSLVNLLYPWRKSEAALPVGELRAGLADLVLRGDQTLVHQFFQKRNVRPQVLSYLVHFLLETSAAIAATTAGPVLLCLEGVHLADELSASALKLLNRYARSKRVPLRICLIAERGPGPAFDALLRDPDIRQEWKVVRLADGAAAENPGGVYECLNPSQREALEAATVFALPFSPRSWAELLPEGLRSDAEASIQPLIDGGVLRRVDESRVRFAHGQLLKVIEDGLDPERRASLHARALESEESADAFAAAWHAAEGRSDAKLRRHCLQAMERAWAVSAYECALTFAERALAAPADDTTFNENLLLAMLNYEAGRYGEARRLLTASLDAPPARLTPEFIEYLRGYNEVFGVGDFKQGIEILGSVLGHYEQKGDKRGAAYIRNSLAFAHFCSRNIDEAITLEELNIDLLKQSGVSDSFLASILQLNLGRLYRTSGEAERALELIREGLFVRHSELTSHAALLFYATLGNFKYSRGDYRGALAAHMHSFELIRNVQLDSVKDQVLLAFSRSVPGLPPERITRSDELLHYVHYHLALTHRRLGLDARASVYLDSIRRKADLLGETAVSAVEAAFRSAEPAPPVEDDAADGFEQGVEDTLKGFDELVREVASGDRVGWVVDALAAGQVVAILRPREIGDRVRVTDSIVIYDPRRRELAERMKLEIGGSHILRATAALLLPESAGLFSDVMPLPLVQQSATLRPEHRAQYPALIPVRICVQLLSPDFDGLLFDIAQGFARKTGVGVLAAAPFHLWRRDLVTTPQEGVLNFLVSSIDALVLGERLAVKVHGSAGVENLLNFRPRLSEEALLIDKGASDSLLIRIKRRGGYATDDLLKLHSGTRPILDLCDGSLSVADIMERMASPQGGRDERVCTFLRNLWHRGALCFDEPPPRVV